MSDVNAETETETAPADDLRSSLASAYAEQETRDSPQADRATPKVAADADASGNGAADTGAADAQVDDPAARDSGERADRVRGPDGKFVRADGKPVAAKAATDNAPVKAATDPTTADPASSAVATGPAALASWTPAQRELFKKQSPEVQEFILGRHRAFEGDYTRKTMALANFRKDYEPVEQIFAPHRDVMRQKGLTPRSLIEAWTNVETKLARGEGVDVIKGLIQGYGIDRNQLASALGITTRQAAQDPAQHHQGNGEQLPYTIDKNGEPIALPPAVMERLAKLDSIEQRLDQHEQFNQAIVNEGRSTRERRVMNTIESFKSATDENGNLKHPHFEDVEGRMATFAKGMLESGETLPPLDELYEMAVYANPSTRQSIRAAEMQAAEAKRSEEAKAKAAAARKAGSSVTGYPSAGQAPGTTNNANRSLRDELMAAANEAA